MKCGWLKIKILKCAVACKLYSIPNRCSISKLKYFFVNRTYFGVSRKLDSKCHVISLRFLHNMLSIFLWEELALIHFSYISTLLSWDFLYPSSLSVLITIRTGSSTASFYFVKLSRSLTYSHSL